MPVTTDRYKKFLTNYSFFTNSISFRIHSSKALEKWKNVQAFQLNQLINGKFFFPKDRKEILLLKYDLWSRWLYEIENLCVELSNNNPEQKITERDLDLIIVLAEKTAQKYKDIINKEYPERFDKRFTDIWLEEHYLGNSYMINKFKSLTQMSFDKFFITVVDVLTEIMQYTLIEIHELDTMICKKDGCNECLSAKYCPDGKKNIIKKIPFVIITDLAQKAYKLTNECLITQRLTIYKKYFQFNEIYLKNYTDYPIDSALIQRIESLDIGINYKLCVTK